MSRDFAVRTFNWQDQQRFAAVSGDWNPLHVDPFAARRSQAGAAVVHGIHAALWALEELLAGDRPRDRIAMIDLRFQRFIYVGATVVAQIVRDTESGVRIALIADGVAATVCDLRFGERRPALDRPQLDTLASVGLQPIELRLEDLPGRKGEIPLSVDGIITLFPRACAALGVGRVAGIAGMSMLVGMVCPGMHSLFGAATLELREPPDGASSLTFHVERVDPRFQSAEIGVSTSGLTGTLTAFVRPRPVEQRALREIARFVDPAEFAEVRALVVGGSRGLGAATAKILAAGGARVVLTYVAGELEARALAAEIGAAACRAIRYDAREAPDLQLAALDSPVDQLYYFASPHIFRQHSSWFDRERFDEFCTLYVDGFELLCRALRGRAPGKLAAFYPSSTAVGERPRDMTEYAMAKAAGEVLCADIDRFAGIRVLVERLPRTLTDQTATLAAVDAADAVDVMLPIVRRLSRLSAT